MAAAAVWCGQPGWERATGCFAIGPKWQTDLEHLYMCKWRAEVELIGWTIKFVALLDKDGIPYDERYLWV